MGLRGGQQYRAICNKPIQKRGVRLWGGLCWRLLCNTVPNCRVTKTPMQAVYDCFHNVLLCDCCSSL